MKKSKIGTPHPLLKRFLALKISWAQAASEIGMAKSTLHAFLKGRKVTHNHAPAVSAWIKSKQQERTTIKTKPMLRSLFALGLGVHEAADAMRLPRSESYRILNTGEWPDEKTLKHFQLWLTNQKEKGGKKMLTKISLPEEALEHWGLRRDPFTNEMEASEDILDLKDLRAAERKILNAVDKNGWVAVTGPVGSGKTILLKKVEGRLAGKKDVVIVKPRIIEKQYLGASHVCDSILEDLGTSSVLHRATLEHKARLVGRTLEEVYRDGKRVVILIDEAHLLRPEALLALKRIYEFEVGFKKLLSIVLVGQSRLARELKSNFELAEVSQRVDLYELGSLNGAVGQYLLHKLSRAGLNGASAEIFDKSAIKAIQERADTPLSVNNLASAALLSAWDVSEKHVTGEIVKGIQGGF